MTLASMQFFRKKRMRQAPVFKGKLLKQFLLVALTATHDSGFLSERLETTMAKLGGRVNELKVDLFKSPTRSLRPSRLAQGDDPFFRTWS